MRNKSSFHHLIIIKKKKMNLSKRQKKSKIISQNHLLRLKSAKVVLNYSSIELID